jgi:hypothetical protein
MLGTLGTHVLIKKKGQMSLYGESHFDTQLSHLLQFVKQQLINPLLVELWDDYEHSLLKKHKGKLMWSQQPNGKMS